MRSRNIKPGLFKNELLGEADPLYTILFTGLWCLADKSGRLEDRPSRIRIEILPYREITAKWVDQALDWLMENEFIVRYESEQMLFIQIVKWHKHQNPHHKETESAIPELTPNQLKELNKSMHELSMIHAQIMHGSSKDHTQVMEIASSPLIPDSGFLIPDSLIPDSCSSSDERLEICFDDFWELWPKKQQKALARKSWGNLTSDEQNLAIADIRTRPEKDKQWTDKQFIPYPATYLNGKRWEDEYQEITHEPTFDELLAQNLTEGGGAAVQHDEAALPIVYEQNQ